MSQHLLLSPTVRPLNPGVPLWLPDVGRSDHSGTKKIKSAYACEFYVRLLYGRASLLHGGPHLSARTKDGTASCHIMSSIVIVSGTTWVSE